MWVTFTKPAQHETAPGKGPSYERGEQKDFRDDIAHRWIRRNVAVEGQIDLADLIDDMEAGDPNAGPEAKDELPALGGLNKVSLLAIAAAEGVEIDVESTKAVITAAIEAHRAAGAAGDDETKDDDAA